MNHRYLLFNRLYNAGVYSAAESTVLSNATNSTNSSQASNNNDSNSCPVHVSLSMHMLNLALILALIKLT